MPTLDLDAFTRIRLHPHPQRRGCDHLFRRGAIAPRRSPSAPTTARTKRSSCRSSTTGRARPTRQTLFVPFYTTRLNGSDIRLVLAPQIAAPTKAPSPSATGPTPRAAPQSCVFPQRRTSRNEAAMFDCPPDDEGERSSHGVSRLMEVHLNEIPCSRSPAIVSDVPLNLLSIKPIAAILLAVTASALRAQSHASDRNLAA